MKHVSAMMAFAVLLLVPPTVRCAEPSPPSSPGVQAEPAKQDAGPATTPPASPGMKGNSKMMKMLSGTEGAEKISLSGKVVEVLNGGGYTYLCLEKEGKKRWAAVPTMDVKVGAEMTLNPGAEMNDFTSKSLNRTFDRIVFSDGPVAPPAPAAPSQDTAPIRGKILQTMTSGEYTYVLLKRKGGEEQVWVAVPAMSLVVGEERTFAPGMVMTNFKSKGLNRTFDKIVFSQGPLEQKKGAKDDKSAKKPAGKEAAAGGKIAVEKAEGQNAYRVAELFKLKDKLSKKKIVVRGKVVSVSANIMKKNWIHLQDGSGDPKKNNNDLVVTSQTLPAEGEVVTASGVLRKDVAMGNHKFPLVVEDAEIAIK